MKVLYAQMNESLFVPGIGAHLPRTIDPKHTGAIDMTVNDERTAVLFYWKDKRFLIPLNNFQALVLED
jgi:hypothetical protein